MKISFPPPHKRREIYLIGDSITQRSFDNGWGSGLSNWYGRTADIFNRGFSGYNSRFLKEMMPILFPSLNHECILMTIFLGTNDAVSPSSSQHVPLEEFKENIEFIVKHCFEVVNPTMKVILITPVTMDTSLWPACSPKRAAQYADSIREIAAEHNHGDNILHKNVFLVDLWKDIPFNAANGEDPSLAKNMQPEDLDDGLHFGLTGNGKVLCQLKHLIRQQCASICPEQVEEGQCLGMHFPHWSELTTIPPEEALQNLRGWKWS